jgi:hypothetical protein
LLHQLDLKASGVFVYYGKEALGQRQPKELDSGCPLVKAKFQTKFTSYHLHLKDFTDTRWGKPGKISL